MVDGSAGLLQCVPDTGCATVSQTPYSGQPTSCQTCPPLRCPLRRSPTWYTFGRYHHSLCIRIAADHGLSNLLGMERVQDSCLSWRLLENVGYDADNISRVEFRFICWRRGSRVYNRHTPSSDTKSTADVTTWPPDRVPGTGEADLGTRFSVNAFSRFIVTNCAK
mgnify:CR=1 FL=1